MSDLPEQDPLNPDDSVTPVEILPPDRETGEAWTPEQAPLALPLAANDPSLPIAEVAETEQQQPAAEPPLFQSYTQPEIVAPERIPNLGNLVMLGLLVFVGLLCAGLLTWSAMYFHLFGVATPQQAMTDIRYILGSQALAYFFTFGACLLVFPLFWHESFLAGLQWRGRTALKQGRRLTGAAFVCFGLAIADGLLFHETADTPIEKLFRSPGAAWLLFAFAVTLAPFFEEIVFRGFLLPSLCTAWDWAIEKSTGKPARPLDANGHPQWSLFAMIAGSVLTSIPFAAMHLEQTGYAVGPFLLLVCVSLVLCWARLSTRSLAASVLVHACYNFLLFSIMLLGTGGFKHLDKM